MLLAYIWREDIKTIRPWGYKAILGVLLIALFCVLPRYSIVVIGTTQMTECDLYTKMKRVVRNCHH